MDIATTAEVLFAYYLEATIPADVGIRPARRGGSAPETEMFCLVEAEGGSNFGDLPPVCGIYDIDLNFTLRGTSTGTDQPNLLDQRAGQILAAVQDIAQVQSYLNYTSGIDRRPENNFHIYAVMAARSVQDVDSAGHPYHLIGTRITAVGAN